MSYKISSFSIPLQDMELWNEKVFPFTPFYGITINNIPSGQRCDFSCNFNLLLFLADFQFTQENLLIIIMNEPITIRSKHVNESSKGLFYLFIHYFLCRKWIINTSWFSIKIFDFQIHFFLENSHTKCLNIFDELHKNWLLIVIYINWRVIGENNHSPKNKNFRFQLWQSTLLVWQVFP